MKYREFSFKKYGPWEGFAVSYVPGIANLKMRLGNKAPESRKQGVWSTFHSFLAPTDEDQDVVAILNMLIMFVNCRFYLIN